MPALLVSSHLSICSAMVLLQTSYACCPPAAEQQRRHHHDPARVVPPTASYFRCDCDEWHLVPMFGRAKLTAEVS